MYLSQFRTYIGALLAFLPAIAGVLYAGFKLFVTHGLPAPGRSRIVTVSGLDCLRGVDTVASCGALRDGLIVLFVAVVIGYFAYQRAAGYLLFLAGLFGVAGTVLGNRGNFGPVLLSAGVLIAVGALVMEPEMLTERVRDGLDGRSDAE